MSVNFGANKRPGSPHGRSQIHPTKSVYKVVSQKSISSEIRQLVIYISNHEGYVNRFVREFTLAKQLYKHFR